MARSEHQFGPWWLVWARRTDTRSTCLEHHVAIHRKLDLELDLDLDLDLVLVLDLDLDRVLDLDLGLDLDLVFPRSLAP